jgi:hypothetical protein
MPVDSDETDEYVNAVCIAWISAYECWLSRDFSGSVTCLCLFYKDYYSYYSVYYTEEVWQQRKYRVAARQAALVSFRLGVWL